MSESFSQTQDLSLDTTTYLQAQALHTSQALNIPKPLPLTRTFSHLSSSENILDRDIRHPTPVTISEAFAKAHHTQQNIITCPRCNQEFEVEEITESEDD